MIDQIYDGDRPKVQQIKEAIQKGSLNHLEQILKKCQYGREVNDVDEHSQTPIFFAGVYPREQFGLAATQLLIKNGADPKHKDVNIQNVLFYLCKQGKAKILRRLMNCKYNLNQNDYIKQTPIFFAAVRNQIECAEILIESGADVNHLDYNYQNCLFYAAREGYLDMCRLLVKHGCNPTHKDNKNDTALKYAKLNRRAHVVQFLNSLRNEKKKMPPPPPPMIQPSIIRQQSSNNLDSNRLGKQRKQIQKFDYLLVYTTEDGHVHELTQQQLIQFSRSSENNRKIFQLLQHPERIDNQPAPQQKKFEKICNKILTYFWKLQNAHYFHQPVDYEALKLIDYTTVIKHPMDFGTVKTKLNFNGYSDPQQFKVDMLLVFQNCITYNGNNSLLGKIAIQMKMQFLANFKKDFPSIS